MTLLPRSHRTPSAGARLSHAASRPRNLRRIAQPVAYTRRRVYARATNQVPPRRDQRPGAFLPASRPRYQSHRRRLLAQSLSRSLQRTGDAMADLDASRLSDRQVREAAREARRADPPKASNSPSTARSARRSSRPSAQPSSGRRRASEIERTIPSLNAERASLGVRPERRNLHLLPSTRHWRNLVERLATNLHAGCKAWVKHCSSAPNELTPGR